MNLPTILVTVFTLWLVMGLGFLSTYAEVRRKGKPTIEAWLSYEGILLMVSVAVPILIGVYRLAMG